MLVWDWLNLLHQEKRLDSLLRGWEITDMLDSKHLSFLMHFLLLDVS